MRNTSRTLWLMAALLSLCLIAMATPAEDGGQKGGKKKPPPAEEQVEVLEFMILNTSGFDTGRLLSDDDPEVLYVDHRIADPGVVPDPCVTGWVQDRGSIFAYLDRGHTVVDPDDPLFTDCNEWFSDKPNQQPNGPRTYGLRLPDGSHDDIEGDCCSALGLLAEDGYCTLAVDVYDGKPRIRAGRIFTKKISPVDLDFLFYHTVAGERRSFELQSEGALLVEGGGDYRSIITNPQDMFRLVEIGGPTLCSGFPFLLDIEFVRVEAPADG